MVSAATVALPDRAAPSRATDRFRLLVDGIKDFAIFMLDGGGKVETWSAGAERLLGYKADEVVGVDFALFHTPEGIQTGLPRRALALAERDGRYEEKTWLVRKDGSRSWADVVITALRDASGQLVGYGSIA
ncbi:MAG TPA: PAS domain S-box protein, partial [Vicinamibacteria bacterium]|nr:PAS domain S-box protein [Vicinamibacteria bacterium]